MKIARTIIGILAILLTASAFAQNRMTVPSLQGRAGNVVSVPVSMDNQQDIVGVQFDIQLPFSKSSSKDVTLNASRNTNGHTVGVRSLGNNKYTIVVVNMAGRPLSGNSGVLLTIPMTVASDAQPDVDYPIILSNVVMTDNRGNNMQEETVSGYFTLQREPSPDLTVGRVSLGTATLTPGEEFAASWLVSNIGEAATGSGWTEKLYLVSEETGEAVYIGNQYFSNKLTAGGYITRSATMTLPQTLGIEGDVRLRVDVESNSSTGEYIADRANNSATMENTAWLNKKYFLSAGSSTIREGGSVRFTVKRSGDRSMEEILPVVTDNELLTVPSSVTIPAGQASVSFTVACPDNDTVNERSEANITVGSANEIAYVSLTIDDDDLLALTAQLDKTEYNEGEVMHLTVSVPRRIGTDDVVLSFNIEQSKRFRLPQSYTFEPGATTATIDIPVLQDKTPANQASIQLTVSAVHHEPASVLFILNDDDTPAIDLSLTPEAVSEGAGANAIYGTITRQGVTDSKITLKLSDNSNNELYYTSTLTMPEGTTQVTFPIGVRDNQKVDGDRTIAFTAEIYLTDCNCSAIGDLQTSVTKNIQVLDNDGPTLSISASKTTILEGNADGTVLTISRNNDTTLPLTVQLEASVSDVTYPLSVTIPAGQESVTTTLSADANGVQEGNRTITVKAMAEGYSSGVTWLLISDQTLPDICLTNPMLLTGSIAAGTPYSLTLPITNIGAATMPAGSNIEIQVGGTVRKNVAIPEDITVGQTLEMIIGMDGETVPGNYTMTVRLNSNQRRQELQYLNNTATSEFTVTTVYAYTIASDKDKYLIGDAVQFSGTVTTNGSPATYTAIEPYILFNGVRTALKATTDADGQFTATYTIPQGMGGDYSYGVCVPSEGLKTSSGNFGAYGMSRATTEYIKHNLFVDEPYLGKISLKNLSSLPLHNITATVDDPSGHHTVLIPAIEELAGNATADMEYVITSSSLSDTKGWDEIAVHISSDEGATLDLTFYNYTRSHTPTLVTSTTSINTTVNKYAPRTYPLILTNTGLGETGAITVEMPEGMKDFISLLTPSRMPSLATGDSVTVMLRFNGANYDLNLVQRGNIAINCENGAGKAIYFNVKVVSEEKGNLLVRVRDENTIYGNAEGEHPYVADATVQVTDYNTGAIVASATTNSEGYYLFEDLDEGYYQLYVTAAKHDSYRQNILVSPGETTEHLATISYQAVSVSWNVEETTVDDEYEITTTIVYETRVPVPVVVMHVPDTIPLAQMHVGESFMFNCELYNQGLITARRVHVDFPSSVKGYVFTPMVAAREVDIPAETGYTIPVVVSCVGLDSDGNTFVSAGGAGGSGGSGSGGSGSGGSDNGSGGSGDNGDNGGGSGGSGGGSGGSGGDGNGGSGSGGTSGGGNSDNGGGNGGSGDGGSGDGGDPNRGRDPSDTVPCAFRIEGGYEWPCGEDSKFGFIADLCKTAQKRSNCVGNGGWVDWNGGGGGKGSPGTPDNYDVPSYGAGGGKANIEYLLAVLCVTLECVPFDIPAGNELRTGNKIVKGRGVNGWDAAACAGGVLGGAAGLKSCLDVAKHVTGSNAPKRAPSVEEFNKMPDLVRSYFIKLANYVDYEEAQRGVFVEWIGLTDSTYVMNDELAVSLTAIDEQLEQYYNAGTLYDIDPYNDIPVYADPLSPAVGQYALTALMPGRYALYENFDLRRYVEHEMNDYRIKDGNNPINDNYTHIERLQELEERMDSCLVEMRNKGFATWDDLIMSANNDRLEFYENQSGSVCAHVKLEINQKLVLTRQAFRGTLTVDNSLSTPLTDISMAITATDLLGNVATSREMQINIESITGFEGDKDGEWTLAPGQTGVATILFIPTKYAAPDTLTTYAFGGTLYFNDGNDLQARTLYPVKLQVKPSPELDLTYFVQRDIYGDNPLTEDVVEPVIPAEFTVLINNKGKGDATNVRMTTHQPEIVENEKGLKVEFAIVGSSLNGKDHTMALDSTIVTQFGDIPAGTTAYATWDLTSTLLGHFTQYDVRYTHVTSYGNPDLSLLDQVTVHELIHSVNARVGDQKYRAWVTNEYEDGHSLPDHIYLSNGTDEELTSLLDVTDVERVDDHTFRVTVNVPQREWFYTKLTNPAGSNGIITRIVNETAGEVLDPDNFWTTEYTMRDGLDPVRENKLHIVDLANAPGPRTYLVEFINPNSEIIVHGEAGWNWLGSNVLQGPLVQNVIGDNLVEVRTARQMIYNDPEWGYFGDAGMTLSADLDNGHFRVKLKRAQDILLTGTVNLQPAWSNLRPNWNWVSNPCFTDFNLNDYPYLWTSLCEGDMLKAKNGYFATLENGEWNGLLKTMEAGKAYALWTTTNAKNIQFDAAALLASTAAPQRRTPSYVAETDSPWNYDDSQFENNMSIIAIIDFGFDANVDDFSVGSFVGDECRGEGEYSKDKWYIFAHGETGDVVSFRLYHRPTGIMVDLDTTLPFAESAGTSKEPIQLYAPAILEEITTDIHNTNTSTTSRVYNIQGIELTGTQLRPGIYIQKRPGASRRVLVR